VSELGGLTRVLALRSSPRVRELIRRGYAPVLLLGTLAVTLTLVVFLRVTALEQQRAESAFAEAVRDRVLVIQREVEYTLRVVRDLGSFFDASQYVTRRQFREFVGPSLRHSPGITTLEWVPRITDRQRETFLAQARRGFPRFRILEAVAGGEAREAGPRPEYLPILYVQPYARNKLTLGLDLASIPEDLAAMERAALSAQMEASLPLTLDGDSGPVTGFAAYLALYEKPDPGEAGDSEDWEEKRIEPPRNEPRGFVIGRFAIDAIVEGALQTLSPGGIDLDLYTQDRQERPKLLYSHRSRLSPGQVPAGTRTGHIKPVTDSIEVANRKWQVLARPMPGFFEPEGRSGSIVLVGGLAFTILSMFYLFTLIGQKEQIKRLVAQRTLELEGSNAALNTEVAERRRAERALQMLNVTLEQRVARRTAEAERRAQELEQFAYVASHDLKAPLRGVSNLAAWLAEDLEPKLTTEAREQIYLLRDRVARMHALIEGLLDYSRIGRTPGSIERVDTGVLVANTIDSLAPPEGFRVEVSPNMPQLHTDRLHIGQVFANLISNGIKHHDRARGTIRVSGRDLGDHCEFEVVDDGPGIAPEYHHKVFMMFQTLNVKDYGGDTGIGLALVKKLVEEHGGSILLESGSGRGSRFRFTWANEPSKPGEVPASVLSTGEKPR